MIQYKEPASIQSAVSQQFLNLTMLMLMKDPELRITLPEILNSDIVSPFTGEMNEELRATLLGPDGLPYKKKVESMPEEEPPIKIQEAKEETKAETHDEEKDNSDDEYEE